MRINGFRCDACSKEHLFDNPMLTFESVQSALPATWYMVGRGRVHLGQVNTKEDEPLLFCSLACLRVAVTHPDLGIFREEGRRETPTIAVETLGQLIPPIWHDVMAKSVRRQLEAAAPIDAAVRQAHEKRMAEDPAYARQYAQWQQEWIQENEEREDEDAW